jgi:metal-dependent HD superfamily phosphatase/phosphodiesterase
MAENPPVTDHFEAQRQLSHPRARVYKNRGVVIELAASYEAMQAESLAAIEPLWAKYPKTQQFWDMLLDDAETRTNWDMANYLAVNKLGYNDHGMTHGIIAGTSAIRIFDLLVESGIKPDVVISGAGDLDDACLVTASATLLHDIGNQLHRQRHELMGTWLAQGLLDRMLPAIYPDVEQRTELRAFILHAILSHDFDPPPLTFEAGVVGVADGTDVTKGRGRKAFDLGKIDIHSVSALAIDEVHIGPGHDVPVEITIVMNNSAGIFQIEDTLTKKVVHGPLAKWISVVAVTQPADSPNDARIIERLTLKNGVFVAE